MSDTPDTVIEYIPERCSCGHSLEGVTSTGQTRRQVIDIPPIKPHCTEHRSYHKICPHCGMENKGVYPGEESTPVQYGRGIKSMVSYLSACQFLPYKRLSVFFRDVFSLSLSEGSMDNILEEMCQKAEVPYRTIQEGILNSEVVGSDETGCRVNGKNDTWSVRMKELLYRAIALKHTLLAEDYQNPPEEASKLNEQLDVLLSVDASGFHRKEQAFINRLQKHRQSIFTFLLYPNVPSENNGP